MKKIIFIILLLVLAIVVYTINNDGFENVWSVLFYSGLVLFFFGGAVGALNSKKGLDMRTKSGKSTFASREEGKLHLGGVVLVPAIILLALSWVVNYMRPYYWVRAVKVEKGMVVDYIQGNIEGTFYVEDVKTGKVTIKFEDKKTVTLSDAKNSFCTMNENSLNLSSAEKSTSNLLLVLKKESRNLISPNLCDNSKVKENSKETFFKPRKD